DIETTGFSKTRDRIISIAAVKIQNGKIIEYFDELINPGKDINQAFRHELCNVLLYATPPIILSQSIHFYCIGINIVSGVMSLSQNPISKTTNTRYT
ncbi:MAG: exonuclease domain-containing protein, partial [Candidatus Phytoplasma australasiaticum]|nr:exonuclease domain-containing protein [Candidatus Phytoplasma australasiaticum]